MGAGGGQSRAPCQPPTEGKPAPRAGAGCRERQRPSAAAGGGLPPRLGMPIMTSQTHTTQCPGPSSKLKMVYQVQSLSRGAEMARY